MPFRLRGLPAERFGPLFAMSDDELAPYGAVRRTADAREPGYPCRVSLTDSNPGDDAGAMMIGSQLVDGQDLESAIAHQFADPRAAYLHIHFAAPGCYAALVERV